MAQYDISFNNTQTFSRFEQGLITKILAEIMAMNGDITTMMETEYNQFQVIHGIHVSICDSNGKKKKENGRQLLFSPAQYIIDYAVESARNEK